MNKVSLAVVVSHPIQHYVPVYRELANTSGIKVKVFYVAENGAFEYFDGQFDRTIKWDVPLTEGYEFEFLTPGKILTEYGFMAVDSLAVSVALREFNPDFIWINGYAQRVNWRALSAIKSSVKVIYTADSNIVDKRGFFRKFAKRFIVKLFLGKCDHFISYSTRNRDYLEHYGVSPECIVSAQFPVDIDRLESQKSEVSVEMLSQLKAELNIHQGHRIVLFAGKLVAHKRPQDLVFMMDKLRREKVSVIFVGSGVMEASLRDLAERLDLQDRIKFVGFVNQAKLAPYFLFTDIFLFPSEREPYGAIASEVLPFGLPIVAASNIGCVGSSIIEGENGLLYKCGNIDELTEKVGCLLNSPAKMKSFSAVSISLARSHDKAVIASCITDLCLGR